LRFKLSEIDEWVRAGGGEDEGAPREDANGEDNQ
jgi:hypothetical protein